MLVRWHNPFVLKATLQWTTPIQVRTSIFSVWLLGSRFLLSYPRCVLLVFLNIITVTMYNKDADVIRMYRTLLGWETFRKAMDLYFERHDGQAATCDDFRRAMADISDRDLTQFENWYLQAGTPTVIVSSNYDAEAKTYSLTISQRMAPTPNQETKEPFYIAFEVRLLSKDGKLLVEKTLELTQESQTFEFLNPEEEPYVPSPFRSFFGSHQTHRTNYRINLTFWLLITSINSIVGMPHSNSILLKSSYWSRFIKTVDMTKRLWPSRMLSTKYFVPR